MDDSQNPISEDARYIISLDMYEGPLDLLLELIRRHELDILDIPIAFITEKYIEYLDMAKDLNLNLAAEYLEMAAKLIYIKSRSMLPDDGTDPTDDLGADDGPDPREDLIRQLLEYQKYKTAAETLASMPRLGRDTFSRGASDVVSSVEPDLASPGLFALMQALQEVFDRIKGEGDTGTEISITRISISARIHQIIDSFKTRKRMPFLELFDGYFTRSDVVITFLAMLEMTKLGLTRLHQAAPEAEIHITLTAAEEEAIRLLSESRLEDDE